MSTGAIIVAAGAVGTLAWFRLRPSLQREIARAVSTEDLSKLVAFLGTKSGEAQATAFNTAVRSLWDRYERELATDLIKQLAGVIATASIGQYWMKQVQEVEPEIAQSRLGADFLEQFYNPEVAARCGKFG